MFDWLLKHPRIYEISQKLWYRPGQQEVYVRDWISAQPGDCILDIGCGTASILNFLPPVEYSGYDSNPRYIQKAKETLGSKGSFYCSQVSELEASQKENFDIVLANGILHHLPDEEAQQLVSIAWSALKTGGRLITRDGCLEENQNWLARFLLKNDRGHHVRTKNDYEKILRKKFKVIRFEIKRNALRLPYSLLYFELKKG